MRNGFSSARPRAWWLGAALLLCPVAAHAADEEAKPYPECTREPSDSDTTAAKAAFQAGNVSFNEADYPRAILYWEDAYRRDCTKHQMLLNLARAYELNGNKKQAVMALETFVAREPNAPDKPQITRRIEVLKKQIDDEEAAAAQRQQQASPEPTQPPPPSNPPPPSMDQPEADQGSRPIGGLILAGFGGVMVIGGGALYFISSNKVDEYAQQCTNPEERKGCPQEVLEPANAARTRQTIGGAIAIAGVPVIAGGLIWYFASPSRPAGATVVPAVSPGFAGLSLNGSF